MVNRFPTSALLKLHAILRAVSGCLLAVLPVAQYIKRWNLSIMERFGECGSVIADGGEKYLNTIFNEEWLKEQDLLSEQVWGQLDSWFALFC